MEKCSILGYSFVILNYLFGKSQATGFTIELSFLLEIQISWNLVLFPFENWKFKKFKCSNVNFYASLFLS